MKNCIVFILIFLFIAKISFGQDSTAAKLVDSVTAQISEPVETKHIWHFSASPSIGFTFQSTSKDGEENEDLLWLGQLQAKLGFEGEPLQFNSSLFLQFGQSVSRANPPKKTQDNFLLSLVPSMTLSQKLGLRLFFEVTGETEMGEGMIDSAKTRFLDPLFLYETLFLGHKTQSTSDDGSSEFALVFGVGYAYQQTVTKQFALAQNRNFKFDENNPLQHVQDQFTVEKGYSGIFELDFTKRIGDNFSFKTSAKTVILTKADFTQDIKNSRIGTLVLAGLQYRFLSIDYTMHLLYDKNISLRRQLDQTMVFGLKFDI